MRDGASSTPGGLIRRIIALSAKARAHHPSDCLWVYYQQGEITAGMGHPRRPIDAWVARHAIVDDAGKPFYLRLSQLRKTHKALWYLKTEGHMTRFAVGHTVEIAARHYADVPSLRPLHEQTVADALEEAVAGPRVVPPPEEERLRSDVEFADPAEAGVSLALLAENRTSGSRAAATFLQDPRLAQVALPVPHRSGAASIAATPSSLPASCPPFSRFLPSLKNSAQAWAGTNGPPSSAMSANASSGRSCQPLATML